VGIRGRSLKDRPGGLWGKLGGEMCEGVTAVHREDLVLVMETRKLSLRRREGYISQDAFDRGMEGEGTWKGGEGTILIKALKRVSESIETGGRSCGGGLKEERDPGPELWSSGMKGGGMSRKIAGYVRGKEANLLSLYFQLRSPTQKDGWGTREKVWRFPPKSFGPGANRQKIR